MVRAESPDCGGVPVRDDGDDGPEESSPLFLPIAGLLLIAMALAYQYIAAGIAR